MSSLNAFLHPVQGNETEEIVISKRFRGEDGKPAAFQIRAISQEENDRIIKQSQKPVPGGKRGERALDDIEYTRRLVVAATVEPDFRSEALCKAYGTLDPLEVPGKMLLSGEYSRLSAAISRLSGFGDGDLESEAKN